MNDLPAVPKINVALGSSIDELGGQPRKERGEAVEIILRPFFPRVVVALGAFDPHAEERLADVGGDVARIQLSRDEIEIRRRIVVQVTLPDQEFSYDLVVRTVFLNRIAQPIVEDFGALVATLVEPEPEQVGEVLGPKLGPLRALEQGFNQRLALVGI